MIIGIIALFLRTVHHKSMTSAVTAFTSGVIHRLFPVHLLIQISFPGYQATAVDKLCVVIIPEIILNGRGNGFAGGPEPLGL